MGRTYNAKHLPLTRRRVSFKKGWMKRRRMLKKERQEENDSRYSTSKDTYNESIDNQKSAELLSDTMDSKVSIQSLVPAMQYLESNSSTGTCSKNVELCEDNNHFVIENSPLDISYNIQESMPQGRRIVDFSYIWNELQSSFNNHMKEIECQFKDWKLIKTKTEGQEENDSRDSTYKNTSNESIDFQKSVEFSDIMDSKVSIQKVQCLESISETDMCNENDELCEDNNHFVIKNSPLDINNIQESMPQGRRIVNFSHMWNELQRSFNNHMKEIECQFKDWKVIKTKTESQEENDSRNSTYKNTSNESIDFQKSVEFSDTMDSKVSIQKVQCLESISETDMCNENDELYEDNNHFVIKNSPLDINNIQKNMPQGRQMLAVLSVAQRYQAALQAVNELQDNEAVNKIQKGNRRMYNRKRKKPIIYRDGDLVIIRRTQNVPGSKLHAKYLGPYKIVKVLGNDRYNVMKVGEHKGPKNTTTSTDHVKNWLMGDFADDDFITNDETQADRIDASENHLQSSSHQRPMTMWKGRAVEPHEQLMTRSRPAALREVLYKPEFICRKTLLIVTTVRQKSEISKRPFIKSAGTFIRNLSLLIQVISLHQFEACVTSSLPFQDPTVTRIKQKVIIKKLFNFD